MEILKNSEIVSILMFDYSNIEEERIIKLANNLPKKMIRWIGINHPDNKTRKIFYKITGVTIGEGTVINSNFVVSDDYLPLLEIGINVAISPNVTVICCSYPNNSELLQNEYVQNNLIKSEKVVIKDNVWIGTHVVILPGVEIGENSIIGSGSVVTKNIEPNAIYTGVPAKKIRELL